MGINHLVPVIVLLLILLIAVAPIAVFMKYVYNRRASRVQLLWLLAIAANKQMSLSTELSQFAETFRGSSRRRLLAAANSLGQGEPLSDALQHCSNLVPSSTVMAVRVAESSGSVAETLHQEAVRSMASLQRSASAHPVIGYIVYFWALVTILTSIMSFLMYYIVPKLKKVADGFDTELPQVTQWAIWISDMAVWYVIPLMILPVLAILAVINAHMRGWWDVRTSWLTTRFLRFDAAAVLRALAGVVRSGHPLADGLKLLVIHHHRDHMRRRLGIVRGQVERGDDCWAALESQRFITHRERSVLEAAQRSGNLPWVLAELADGIERRFRYRCLYWFEVARPLLVLIMGVVVGFVCISFFMPLVKMINDLT